VIWVLAGAGLLVGTLLPALIARIPDREPIDDEPAPTPYVELAGAPRLPLLLAVATAVVWVAIGAAHDFAGGADLAAYLVAGALGVALGYVDLRAYRLPDWLAVPAFVSATALLAVAAVIGDDWAAYGRAWAAAAACAVLYLVLLLARPADLGLGDVKLAAVLGLLLGWAGWSIVALGVFLAFFVGGVVAVALLVSGRAGRRSSIPFGPPMLVGALLALLWGQLIADTYTGL
jgi:leader peptidase (prepilin peptidase)/N-methyltransferase